jgi:acetolactate synthase-1/3 small subunit
VDVIKLTDLNEVRHIERELVLVKTNARGESRDEVKRLVDIFRGRIIDVTDATYTIELTGSGKKIDALLEALDQKEIIEVVRTGVTGIARGENALHL